MADPNPIPKKLTAKQMRFCQEYVIDWNATRAAIAAGYSRKTAARIGSENLQKLDIESYIEEIQSDIARLAGVSALRNAQELAKIAYTNITDFKDGWMGERQFEELDEDTKAALSEIQYIERETKHGKEKVVKFKVHDKMRAIEILNKMFGYDAPARIDHTTNGKDMSMRILTIDPLENYDPADHGTAEDSRP